MTLKQALFNLNHFKKHRIDWWKSNSIMARMLREYMEETDVINPNDLIGEPHGVPLSKSNQEMLADSLLRELVKIS